MNTQATHPTGRRYALVALLAAALTGCAAGESDHDLIRRLASAPAELPAVTRAPSAATLAVAAGPDDYVALALEQSPQVSAARLRVERLAARVPQARSLEDPRFGIVPFGDMAQTAAGQVDIMVELSQALPLPGKLEARADAAEREAAAALAQLEQVRQEVAAETRRAFWAYWLADRQIEVTQRSRDLLASLREAAEVQLRAGRASQADLLRATTELAELDNRLIDLEQRRQVTIAALNRLLDRPIDAPLPAPPEVVPQELDAALDELLVEAAQQNPRLSALAEEIAAARSQLRLARLDYWPDLMVQGNYAFVDDEGLSTMANGDDQWSIGLGFNIPLWQGRRRAAVREARAQLLESTARLSAEANDVAFDVRQALTEVDAQRRMLDLLRQSILPQARQTVEATAAAYRAGNTDFLSYVDAWRRLLEFELAQRQALAALGSSVATLEQSLGREPRVATATVIPATRPVSRPAAGAMSLPTTTEQP